MMSKSTPRKPAAAAKKPKKVCSVRFEATKLEPLFGVLDALAWLHLPTVGQAAEYAGIDPRTAGKLLKNCVTIGLVETVNDERYSLLLPYPHQGSAEQKTSVVKEALLRMPLLQGVRQFLKLGESLDDALRKAAVVQGVENYSPDSLMPLLDWARQLKVLDPKIDIEVLVDQAQAAKQQRHIQDAKKRIVFLSHSSKDKPFVRQLATDLTAAGVSVWLDEQSIRVGDSIPESVAQGVAESDFFLLAVSEHSLTSEWVKRELNTALVDEIAKRKTKVLPVLLSGSTLPDAIKDKKYADFTKGYKQGLNELLAVVTAPSAED